jgi:hypothetical protein
MDSVSSVSAFTRRLAGGQLAALAASASAAVAASSALPVSAANPLAILGRQAPPEPSRGASLDLAA